MDRSPPGSPIPGILQARTLEWVAFPSLMRESEVTPSCLTLSKLMDCSLPGSSVHGVFQARVLEWVAISFSRGSSWPRDRTQVSRMAGRRFTIWATREAPEPIRVLINREMRGSESGRLEDLKTEKGDRNRGMKMALRNWKRQGNRFSSAALLKPWPKSH